MSAIRADIIIVGAGISGAVLAERYASVGKKVLVIEKRDHIAGNCFDYYNKDKILISMYGAHIFHTNYKNVWDYVGRFADWIPYRHRVVADVEGTIVPIPVNITTVNKLLGTGIENEYEMRTWLSNNQKRYNKPLKNSEEVGLSLVGAELYLKLFKTYTKKQWDVDARKLSPSVLRRIPVRTNFNDLYFSDKYQGIPKGGYTQLVKKMLNNKNIKILLGIDYFDIRSNLGLCERLFYTGPIDMYFSTSSHSNTHLEYRSLRFVDTTHNVPYKTKYAVINCPSPLVPYTRMVEHKHITGQQSEVTVVTQEYPSRQGEPFYPIPNSRNNNLYLKYKYEVSKLKNIHFVGRLANYKYFDMDEAIKNALDIFSAVKDIDQKP